jgi:hypothetical protein
MLTTLDFPVILDGGFTTNIYGRFNVLKLICISMKFSVFWDVAPCSHVEVDRRFRRAYCLHHQGDAPSR